MPVLNGLGVSPGVAAGRALVVRPRQRQLFYLVAVGGIADEVARLTDAQARSRAQLEEIGARLARVTGPGPASLFEAQLLMLDDPMLVGRAEQLIRGERRNAEWALQHAADELIAMLDEARDAYLRERHGDIRDVVGRLVMNLRGDARGIVLPESTEPWILIADELPPSIAAQVNWQTARGFVTEAGSWTYHTAILARSLGVPAVVGVAGAASTIDPGSEVVLDGATGDVVVDGAPAERARLMDRAAGRIAVGAAAAAGAELAARPERLTTADGVVVRLDANLELPSDLPDVLRAGAEGIGLFRSEFLLSASGEAPDEDVQVAIYRDLLAQTPGEVTIRTFDPKPDPTPDPSTGFTAGHHLGLRALQVDASFRALFGVQVRALLRAAPAGRLRILLPFVTSAHDVHLGRALIARTAEDLRAQGVEAPAVPIGAMVEVPSAALTADHLAEEADFLSVGTNDLIALTLAVDRDDERASRFYAPLHASMLRLLRFVSRASARAGRRVAVCGEMAADPRALVVLVGLGFREFSMGPAAIARARQVLTHVAVSDTRRLVRAALRRSDTFEAELDALVRTALDVPVTR
jgi:phosphoenolpyruvate-protein phosphotransferase (PTS system enzyme I)